MTLPSGEIASEISISLVETALPSPSATPTLTLTPTPTISTTPTLTPIPGPTNTGWKVQQALVVSKRAGAWLRPTPDSDSQRIISVLPNGTAVTISGPSYYDGVQWWWLVTAQTGQSGWVEESALNLTASKNWNVGQRLEISKTQEVWLRDVPRSTSDEIVAVLGYKSVVTVSGEPDYDGAQWWWLVTTRTEQSGWAEQDSLTEYVPPTAIPRPRDPIVPPVNDPIPTIEQPPDIPGIPPPGALPQQPPAPTRRPPAKPTVEQPPDIPATQAPSKEPTVEQPPTVEAPPDIPATPPGIVTTEPPPGGQTPEFPPTVVAIDPVVIAIAPSLTPTPATGAGS